MCTNIKAFCILMCIDLINANSILELEPSDYRQVHYTKISLEENKHFLWNYQPRTHITSVIKCADEHLKQVKCY